MQPERRTQALTVHELILGLFSRVQVSMKYKMPTYESDHGWIAIGNQKNYWSVYTCSPEKIECYVRRHPRIKHGKGCLNFKPNDTVNADDLEPVVRNALQADSVKKRKK